ncbi:MULTISPECIES: SIMPL domain-containing protein [Streptomyces]|uniref:SIMPL domain-containing protein n=1 Tax=Streptomyces salyersiae TaxID=3075530 RepID=A0ABU2RKA8_9ACTN|nr:SIMPL domain-containing protein [Streptomyces sp. DSM 41770]MDT0429280.1 SIMPL domain-containing protein [Streptomyces sp. DSM 41770]
MNTDQHIGTPWGVSVSGTASEDAVPDLARLRVAIEQTEDTPAEAFAATRRGVDRVREVLRGHGVPGAAVSTSRLNLESRWSYGESRRFLGYECTASFVVELRDLDTLETVLIDLVDAGANQVAGVEFDVRRKEELRALARAGAVAAAREKAVLYAEAAGARLGPVVHITDVDAGQTQGYRGHSSQGGGGEGDLTPGKVTVSAGVVLGFSLLDG